MRLYKKFETPNQTKLNVYFTDENIAVIKLNHLAKACGYSNYCHDGLLDKIVDNQKILLYTKKNRWGRYTRFCDVSSVLSILENLLEKLDGLGYYYFHDPRKKEIRYLTVTELSQWFNSNVLSEFQTNKNEPVKENDTAKIKYSDIEDIGKYSNAICEIFEVDKNKALNMAIKLKQAEVDRDLSPLFELVETA